MKDKEVKFNSLKDFGEAYFKLHPEIEVQKILSSYGINVEQETAKNIEVILSDGARLQYIDKSTNECITYDLTGRVLEKYGESSTSLKIENNDKTFIQEHFFAVPNGVKRKKLKVLESITDDKAKLLSRAYVDVETKYGIFCLHIEEGYTNSKYGPNKVVSLYYGDHNKVIIPWKNDFDFNRFCLFRCKYIDLNKFDQLMIGYTDNYFLNPTINIWNYRLTNKNNEKIESPIYGGHLRTINEEGVILIDGSLKLKENENYVPEFFCRSLFETMLKEYEDITCDSKAYFSNYIECVIIIKKDSKIIIEVKKYEDYEYKKIYSKTIESKTDDQFTLDDFNEIQKQINKIPVKKELIEFINKQLKSYSNVHDAQNFNELKNVSLEDYSFDDMLKYITQSDLKVLIENGLESLAQLLNIDIEKILGENIPNQEEVKQYIKK